MLSTQHRYQELITKEDLEVLILEGYTDDEINKMYPKSSKSYISKLIIRFGFKSNTKKNCYRKNHFSCFRNKLSESAILSKFDIDCFK